MHISFSTLSCSFQDYTDGMASLNELRILSIVIIAYNCYVFAHNHPINIIWRAGKRNRDYATNINFSGYITFYQDVLTHIVKTCGTVAFKTTGEPLFAIESYAECYVFPGLTLAQLESIPTAVDPETNCPHGVGKDLYVQIFTFQ